MTRTDDAAIDRYMCRTEEDVDEQRQLAYVAIARSWERLYLTGAPSLNLSVRRMPNLDLFASDLDLSR
jgi:superfamily I DNA/RNA helicase